MRDRVFLLPDQRLVASPVEPPGHLLPAKTLLHKRFLLDRRRPLFVEPALAEAVDLLGILVRQGVNPRITPMG
jgi:hypothetical protein